MRQSRHDADRTRRDLYELMNQDRPFEEKAERALEIGKEFLGVDNAHLTTVDPQSDYWEAIASTDPPDGTFPAGLVLDLGSTYCRRTIEEDEAIALHDAADQGWADDPAFETHGLPTYHGTSIVLGDDVFGTVCFVSERPKAEPFSESETMFAELLSRMLEFELARSSQQRELERRATLIAVLNRVLRHNLRNDITVIRGRVELLADQLSNGSDHVEIVLSKADTLVALSEKVRTLEPTSGSSFDRQETDVASLLDRVVSEVEAEYPSASISTDDTVDITVDVMPGFRSAVREVIENAAKHSGADARILVSTTAAPNAVEIHVSDNGPGLPDHERDVLKRGKETPLVHGSGFGLWLVYWLVTSHGGTIDSTVTECGTTITVTVPRTRTTVGWAGPEPQS